MNSKPSIQRIYSSPSFHVQTRQVDKAYAIHLEVQDFSCSEQFSPWSIKKLEKNQKAKITQILPSPLAFWSLLQSQDKKYLDHYLIYSKCSIIFIGVMHKWILNSSAHIWNSGERIKYQSNSIWNLRNWGQKQNKSNRIYMKGYPLLKEIRKSNSFQNCLIVILTTSTTFSS